jgi:DEAD/DEAH box helicase domain-containing protein
MISFWPTRRSPADFNYPGGIGLSPALFDLEKELLRHSLKTSNVCPCQEGCPSCVGPSRETGRRAKQVAQEILRGLLEE